MNVEDQIHARNAELQNLLSDERNRCQQHKQCYQILKEKHKKVEEELSFIYEKLRESCEQYDNSKTAYELQIEHLETKYKEKQKEINALLLKIKDHDVKKIQDDARAEVIGQYESTIKELHLENDKLRDQCSSFHYENAVLKCKLESQEAQHSRTVERINLQHLSEVEQMQSKIDFLLQEKQPTADCYAVELKSVKREVLQLNSKLKTASDECEELRAQNENLSLQIKSINTINLKQNGDHVRNIRAFESEKSKLCMQRDVLEKELENAQEHRRTSVSHLQASRREVLSLKGKLESLEHKHQKLITDLKLEKDQFKAQRDVDREHHSEEIAKLQSEIQSYIEKQAHEQQAMVEKEEALQQSLASARQQFWKQSREIEEKKLKLENQLSRLESEKNQVIGQLQQELQSATQKLQFCIASKSDLEKELLSAREQFGKTCSQIDGLNQNSTYEKDIQDLKQKFDSLLKMQDDSSLKQPTHNNAEVLQLKLSFEQQKLQFRQRIEELESHLKENKTSFSAEKKEMDFKMKQYSKQIAKLKEKLDAKTIQHEQLNILKEKLSNSVPPEVHLQIKNKLLWLQKRLEEYRTLLVADPSSSLKNLPLISAFDSPLTDIKNTEYQPLATQDIENIIQSGRSGKFAHKTSKNVIHNRGRSKGKPVVTESKLLSSTLSSSSDLELENL